MENLNIIFSTEIVNHIISFVPCGESDNWDNIRSVCGLWKDLSDSENGKCPNPHCSPEKLMIPILMKNNPTLLRHWWSQAKHRPELVMSDFVIEVCITTSIGFVKTVLTQCKTYFFNNADTKRRVSPFLRSIMSTSCEAGRADIVELLVKTDSMRITRSTWKRAAERLEQHNDSRCLNVLANLDIAVKTFSESWWINYLVNENMSLCMYFLMQNHHAYFCTPLNVKHCVIHAINSGHQALAVFCMRCESFIPFNTLTPVHYTLLGAYGWSDCVAALVEHPAYEIDSNLLQQCFNKACAHGHADIISYLLDNNSNTAHHINVNYFANNGLFTDCMNSNTNAARFLLGLAGHRLQLVQSFNDSSCDPLVLSIREKAFDIFDHLLNRGDISIWTNSNVIISELLKCAEEERDDETKQIAIYRLQDILKKMDTENKKFQNKNTAYRIIRYARKCSDDAFVHTLRNNGALIQCIN